MKKHFQKTARHNQYQRSGLANNYGYPHFSPYYAYPPVVFTVHEVPPVSIQKPAPLIWTPRFLQDKYSQLMPPTVIKIAADYIGRFI